MFVYAFKCSHFSCNSFDLRKWQFVVFAFCCRGRNNEISVVIFEAHISQTERAIGAGNEAEWKPARARGIRLQLIKSETMLLVFEEDKIISWITT